MIKIPELETDDVTVTECDTFQIQTNARFHFDNIRFANDWREFLHLADESSPCVEAGYTPVLSWDTGTALKFRDFDDESAPVDVEGDEEPDPLNPPWNQRDIGADEYTGLQPGGYVYWWENVSVKSP